MSFRLFVYYCALCGGWAGFFGWLLGRFLAPQYGLAGDALRGMMVGIIVAQGLSLVDTAWNVGLRRLGALSLRVMVSLIVGGVGGLIAGLIGHAINGIVGFLIGWTLAGLLIGAAVGAFELSASVISGENFSGTLKKFMKSFTGGLIGGIAGGVAAYVAKGALGAMFPDKDPEALLSPSAIGFVILGMSIGLLVGLAQVILKEAWVRVEAGFRPGREMILTKDKTSVGRAEGVDIALFGDNGVEKQHGMIVSQGGHYYLETANVPPGTTFVNEQPVSGRVALKSGDLIKLGQRSLLRFYEKAKK
jgi:hypothetical protein